MVRASASGAVDFGLISSRIKLKKSKSNLHYTRGITPKRVTSGGARLHGLA